MFLVVLCSSNKLMPTVIDKFPDLTEVDEFIASFKLVKSKDRFCNIDLPIEVMHYSITDDNLFRALKSCSIDQHLKYNKYTQITVITMENYPLYAIMDNFEVY